MINALWEKNVNFCSKNQICEKYIRLDSLIRKNTNILKKSFFWPQQVHKTVKKSLFWVKHLQKIMQSIWFFFKMFLSSRPFQRYIILHIKKFISYWNIDFKWFFSLISASFSTYDFITFSKKRLSPIFKFLK